MKTLTEAEIAERRRNFASEPVEAGIAMDRREQQAEIRRLRDGYDRPRTSGDLDYTSRFRVLRKRRVS